LVTEVESCTLGFRCKSCGETWNDDYEVRRTRFSGGTEIQAFYLRGVPVGSPVAGVRCRRCASPRVAAGLSRVA
jgi:hypothetical protein